MKMRIRQRPFPVNGGHMIAIETSQDGQSWELAAGQKIDARGGVEIVYADIVWELQRLAGLGYELVP